MLKIIILFLSISLSLSVKCGQEGNTLYQSPIDIIKCLSSSPIIVKDVLELIELVKKQEYIKIISYLIEKYPEIQQEVLKCLENTKELKTAAENENESNHSCWVVDKNSCLACYRKQSIEISEEEIEKTCNFFCSDTKCLFPLVC